MAPGSAGPNNELFRHLARECVLIQHAHQDKWALIDTMVRALFRNPRFARQPNVSCQSVYNAVAECEREHGTGISGGFAFPHARIPGLEVIGICVAKLETPVDFGALDGQPADIVVLLVVAEEQASLYLRLMAEFARIGSNPADRAFIARIHDADTLYEFLHERLRSSRSVCTAASIMRPSFVDVYPDTPLREITRHMRNFHTDAISVVERDGTLVGEIRFDDVCQLGIPEFFSKLRTIGFISEFDPFEKYFERERNTVARDVMRTDYAALPESATLLEIVFELAIRKHVKVYVVRDGKRIGIIDRSQVLDRVINI